MPVPRVERADPTRSNCPAGVCRDSLPLSRAGAIGARGGRESVAWAAGAQRPSLADSVTRIEATDRQPLPDVVDVDCPLCLFEATSSELVNELNEQARSHS